MGAAGRAASPAYGSDGMMSGPGEGIPDSILEQAADWLFRLHAEPDDPETRNGLDAWIAADPRHARAWAVAGRAWAGTGAIGPVLTAEPAAPLVVPLRPRVARSRRWRVAGMALAAGIAALALMPFVQIRLTADHWTGAAELREVTLADGSRVVLAGDSAMDSRLDGDRRTVSLLEGEAFFRVAHDRARPFVVRVPGATITVTGTAFDVDVTGNTVAVAVAEGSVSVAHAAGEESLTPGGSLLIDRGTGTVHRRAIDPADVAAWRGGRLVVADRPLESVIDTIRRNHSGAILVTGGGLDDRRVTGVYDLTDPARALRALVGPYGGTVRAVTPWLLVVSTS